MFTGLLTFSLMSMGIFGLSNQIPAEKRGLYRRLRAAPLLRAGLIISTAISLYQHFLA